MPMRLFVLAAAIAVALVFSLSPARADQPQYVLNPDGSVEQRVSKVESDVSKLEARIADLERQFGTVAAKPKSSAASTASPAAPSKIRYSVCVNGRCTVHEADAGSPIPFGATTAGEAVHVQGSPCPTGGCGDACGCVGVSPNSGGRRSGWYPGKLLGR